MDHSKKMHLSRVLLFFAWLSLYSPWSLAGPAADIARLRFEGPTGELSSEDMPTHVPQRIELTVGEKLVYDIRWSGIPSGISTLSVKWKREFDGFDVYHIECEICSNTFASLFYPVENRAVSYLDVSEGFSRLFDLSRSEGRLKQHEHVEYDYEKGLALYEERKPGPFSPRTKKSVRIDGPVQDPLSCVYYLRTVELVPGASVRMPVHTSRRGWALTIDTLRREELYIPRFGTLSTLRLEPSMQFPGIFVRRGRMIVWVEEETRIPVQMNVDIPVGSVSATLIDAQNAPLKPKSP